MECNLCFISLWSTQLDYVSFYYVPLRSILSIQTQSQNVLGLIKCNGTKWNVMINNEILLFEFSNNGWNRIEHDEIYFIPSNFSFFVLFNLECIQWNEIFLIKQSNNKVRIIFHYVSLYSLCSAPLCSINKFCNLDLLN